MPLLRDYLFAILINIFLVIVLLYIIYSAYILLYLLFFNLFYSVKKYLFKNCKKRSQKILGKDRIS